MSTERCAECGEDRDSMFVHVCKNSPIDQLIRINGGGPINQQKPGYKADETKLRMDLIAPEIQTALADILTFGAAKYNDRNWEAGMRWGRVFAALMRHLWAWWGKAGNDSETGKSHLWHAAACIMFLIAYESRNTGEDDRP